MYDGSGVPINDEEFLVNSYTSSGQIQPAIAGLHDGGFVVAWESWYQDGSGDGIYAQAYDSEGTKIGAEFRVNSATANDQQLAAITALEDGGFMVAWESYAQDGSLEGIYAQRYILDHPGEELPVGIQLSSVSIDENYTGLIGTLSVVDPDPGFTLGTTHTFEVVSATTTPGLTFSIAGDQLYIDTAVDYENLLAEPIKVGIRVNDLLYDGVEDNYFETTIKLNVNDVIEYTHPDIVKIGSEFQVNTLYHQRPERPGHCRFK